MMNFVKYAQYYNFLYKDKDYRKEADYVERLIKRYSGKRNRTLLDIGCGTGNHDIWFAKKGYQVVGVDKARKMIDIARKRITAGQRVEFCVSDISKLVLRRKFDAAVSLFHVMSYLTTNDIFIKSLRSIYKHLKKGSLFIFDFWYGPAVLTQRPVRRAKSIVDKNIDIRRTTIPNFDFNENTVDVNYKVTALNKKSGLIEIVNEVHKMRYFFLPELDFMLKQSGFKIVKSFKWLSISNPLSPASWSGVVVAKRE